MGERGSQGSEGKTTTLLIIMQYIYVIYFSFTSKGRGDFLARLAPQEFLEKMVLRDPQEKEDLP